MGARVKVVRGVLMALATCGALLAMAGPAQGRGHLDRSFGDEGVVDLRARPDEDPFAGLRDVRVGPGRKIFFTEEASACRQGGCPDRIYLRRYSARGELSLSFGDDSRVEVGLTDAATDLVVDPAGRPLVALQKGNSVVIKRFRADGRADPSFGDSGSAVVRCGCHLESLGVGPGHKPLLVGNDELRRSSPFRGMAWVLARLHSDGSADRSLGGDGIVRHPMPGFYGSLAEIEPSGGALLYGETCCRVPSKPFVQRISERGHLQRRYAAATKRALHGLYGTRKDDFSWFHLAVVLRPNGKVEIYGGHDRPSVAIRLLRNGKRDPSFGHRGVRMLKFGVTDAIAARHGGTLLTGHDRRGVNMVMRLRHDGRTDRGFGRVDLPNAFNEEGLELLPHGPRAALVFDAGFPSVGCRQACESRPKLFRVVAPGT